MADEEIHGELLSMAAAMPSVREQLRLAALDLALRHLEDADDERPERHESLTALLRDGDRVYTWITAPPPVVRLVGHIGTPTPTPEGNPMANPQVPVTYSLPITIEPEDSDGNAVSDSLTWSSSDDTNAPVTADDTTLVGTVQVLNPAVDVVVTATDGVNTFTYEFDAVVDAPVTLVGTVGVPFKTPPAAPSA